jgi:hypothetical protein
LGQGNLRLAVVLPEGEDLNEWLALNVTEFFNALNMVRNSSIQARCGRSGADVVVFTCSLSLSPDDDINTALWNDNRVLHASGVQHHVCWS